MSTEELRESEGKLREKILKKKDKKDDCRRLIFEDYYRAKTKYTPKALRQMHYDFNNFHLDKLRREDGSTGF
jgi:hypothetical protein